VADTGIGMSPEFLSQVFQPFTQEDGTAIRGRSGTGIGLAVTRKQAELMGGVITATSEQGKGSTFTAVIPFRVSGDAEAEHEPAGGYPPLAGRRILIVEDTAENAEIVADLLELEDAESERAENGREGLDMFSRSEEGYYDAILMDLRMPVMNGSEACVAIRSRNRPDARTIPIIAMTADLAKDSRESVVKDGMNGFVYKPIHMNDLYDTLYRMMKQAVDIS
jgi:CheY-like chemotaxis protein